MDRKVEKLTDVLVFADSAGLRYVIYFYRWFEEQASETSGRSGHEIHMLMSAASRVLKKLFINKVRALSSINFDQRVFTGCLPAEDQKRTKDIREMLINAMVEVAQETNAEEISQAHDEPGHGDVSESQDLVPAGGLV